MTDLSTLSTDRLIAVWSDVVCNIENEWARNSLLDIIEPELDKRGDQFAAFNVFGGFFA